MGTTGGPMCFGSLRLWPERFSAPRTGAPGEEKSPGRQTAVRTPFSGDKLPGKRPWFIFSEPSTCKTEKSTKGPS